MSGKVITIAQQKGGSGKTTLAANLAIAFSAMNLRVALLDTDPQGSLGRWAMTRLEGRKEPDILFSTASAWGVSYELTKLRSQADIILVDTPPKVDSDLRPALREAKLVLVPVATSQVDLWATESVLELADREQAKALIVLNRARAGTRLAKDIAEAITAGRAQTVVGSRVAYAETLGRGLSVLETAPSGPAAKEIKELAGEILAMIA